ncbi:hypothetical protein HWV62_11688 [Athelia sp. TMB]|nr:hypothetical protein HWV62_11688 [Athelia sp. TMB]
MKSIAQKEKRDVPSSGSPPASRNVTDHQTRVAAPEKRMRERSCARLLRCARPGLLRPLLDDFCVRSAPRGARAPDPARQLRLSPSSADAKLLLACLRFLRLDDGGNSMMVAGLRMVIDLKMAGILRMLAGLRTAASLRMEAGLLFLKLEETKSGMLKAWLPLVGTGGGDGKARQAAYVSRDDYFL